MDKQPEQSLALEGSHTWFNALLSSPWQPSFLTKRPCIFLLHWTHRLLARPDVPYTLWTLKAPFPSSFAQGRVCLRLFSACVTITRSLVTRMLLYEQDSPWDVAGRVKKETKNHRDSLPTLCPTGVPILRPLARKRAPFGVFSVCIHCIVLGFGFPLSLNWEIWKEKKNPKTHCRMVIFTGFGQSTCYYIILSRVQG